MVTGCRCLSHGPIAGRPEAAPPGPGWLKLQDFRENFRYTWVYNACFLVRPKNHVLKNQVEGVHAADFVLRTELVPRSCRA